MVVAVLSRVAARALSARCVSRVDGIPIRTLSIGATFRLLRGTRTVSVGAGVVVVVLDESILIPDMLDESVVVDVVGVVTALSVCWLCVGVGAAAPVPSCVDEESVVVVVVVDEGAV
ncbi:MAG: hypothetical protein JWO39_1489 [Gemmatimonadetes bacterium]|nr:hypothetical protein [Gemmatimonadota bacterium]